MIREKERRKERESSEFYLVSACTTLHLNFEFTQWLRPIFIITRAGKTGVVGKFRFLMVVRACPVAGKANPSVPNTEPIFILTGVLGERLPGLSRLIR